MPTYLYLATAVGLTIALQSNDDWRVIEKTLQGQSLTSIVISSRTVLVGTQDGIWRSIDNGQTWSKADTNLTIRHVRWIAKLPTFPATVLVGTEPAAVFVSTDDGRSWRIAPEVEKLRDRLGWFLPYSPEAGCVRGFAVAESGPNATRVYAAVEVGGVLISDDHGRTWYLAQGSDGNPAMDRELGNLIHPDVHSITVHPASPDKVLAATGGGLYQSTDGGRSWKNIYRCYIRAVWVDPEDSRHIIAGPADGVSKNGRIEESRDGGNTWQPAFDGMPAPWPHHMVERFYPIGGQLFAVLSNGQLWAKPLDQSRWHHVLPQVTDIKALAIGDLQ